MLFLHASQTKREKLPRNVASFKYIPYLCGRFRGRNPDSIALAYYFAFSQEARKTFIGYKTRFNLWEVA